jgi:hypothetical protein
MFKNGKSVVRKLALARFGPPSAFEPVLDPERSDPKKGALAARSRGKRTLIVQSLIGAFQELTKQEPEIKVPLIHLSQIGKKLNQEEVS